MNSTTRGALGRPGHVLTTPRLGSLDRIASRRILAPALLFIVAFSFRIAVVHTYNTRHLTSDSAQYFELARQIARGHGYSLAVDGDPEPHFFREPGYSFFAAVPLTLLELAGHRVDRIEDWDAESQSHASEHAGVVAIKYAQAVVDSLTSMLFFLLVTMVLHRGLAFLVALLYALYPPAAFACTALLREAFLTFLTMNMAYSFALFLFTGKQRFLVLCSLFLGVSLLTFQAMLLVPLFFAALAWFYYGRKLRPTIRVTAISTAIALAVVSTNVVRAYSYFPDIRVAKSLGCSLTHEWMAVATAQRLAYESGVISEAEMEELFAGTLYGQPDSVHFERSFDGYYAQIADSLNSKIGVAPLLQAHAKTAAKHFAYSWFKRPVWPTDQGPYAALRAGDAVAVASYALAVGIGLLAMLGTVLYYRVLYPILITYTYFVVMFYVVGSEPRRLLPAVPFFVLFACLGAIALLGWVRRRNFVRAPGGDAAREPIVRAP